MGPGASHEGDGEVGGAVAPGLRSEGACDRSDEGRRRLKAPEASEG
jgi:hypothetical protein